MLSRPTLQDPQPPAAALHSHLDGSGHTSAVGVSSLGHDPALNPLGARGAGSGLQSLSKPHGHHCEPTVQLG